MVIVSCCHLPIRHGSAQFSAGALKLGGRRASPPSLGMGTKSPTLAGAGLADVVLGQSARLELRVEVGEAAEPGPCRAALDLRVRRAVERRTAVGAQAVVEEAVAHARVHERSFVVAFPRDPPDT